MPMPSRATPRTTTSFPSPRPGARPSLGHTGAEASFLAFEAGWRIRNGDDKSARRLTREALDLFLELADADEAYALRVAQLGIDAISLTARTGDVEGARKLLDDLSESCRPTTPTNFAGCGPRLILDGPSGVRQR